MGFLDEIDFYVTVEIKRFVYVYLIETEEGCVLVDSGIAGSEEIIETAMLENGHQPSEIKAIFLTHAHPCRKICDCRSGL